ncbi:MAG: DUF4493 domain-containing protein [Bacteroidales bacterium]|nr:DUF4493 domain-containing protein [Bacteroidales bacterium]
MKKILFLLFPLYCMITACDALLPPAEDGQIEVAFIEDLYLQTRGSSPGVPDTNKFTLKVIGAKGTVLYDGPYGAAPQTILAAAGTYNVTALSGEFKAPAFAAPQYGDSQQVTVKSGQVSRVQLVCRQLNAGIRLKIASAFPTAYPNGSLHLKSDEGKLLYAFSERRFAYFSPGKVSLILSDGGTDKSLLTRDLAARDMLTLDIGVAASSPAGNTSGGISIQVDTTLNWRSEDYTIGGKPGKGKDPDGAMSVPEAKENLGAGDVWVYGYIVGGDLSSSKASFKGPFSSRTNLVIAARAGTTDRSACLSVQLQKGEIRDALNLVDNPENLGRAIYLQGDIVESYYGLPGLQNLSGYQWKE